jgi:hypothetical protein
MRGWFTGYALLIPLFFGNAFAQALFAIPSAIATRFSPKAGLATWLATLAVLSSGIVWYFGPRAHGQLNGFVFAALVVVVGPQAAAYPLCRKTPILVVAVAFAIGLAIAVLWVVLGTVSGSTPD